MGALLNIILPVFLVVGVGYFAVWCKFVSKDNISSLTRFAQNFAIPCLLFYAIAKLDINKNFSIALLTSFYFGALCCFILGFLAAYFYFKLDKQESVCIGFCCLFSNSILLGLPITENAYGKEALGPNFIIISLHAPVCYIIGIAAMEYAITENSTRKSINTFREIFYVLITNPVVVSIFMGILVNLTGLYIPTFLWDGVEIIKNAALPTALFALGGSLYQYKYQGDGQKISFIILVSVFLHPTIVYFIGTNLDLSSENLRSAVITAAMAPGINAFYLLLHTKKRSV